MAAIPTRADIADSMGSLLAPTGEQQQLDSFIDSVRNIRLQFPALAYMDLDDLLRRASCEIMATEGLAEAAKEAGLEPSSTPMSRAAQALQFLREHRVQDGKLVHKVNGDPEETAELEAFIEASSRLRLQHPSLCYLSLVDLLRHASLAVMAASGPVGAAKLAKLDALDEEFELIIRAKRASAK